MIAEKLSEDTLKLLRECDSGAKMAVKSIDEVLDEVKSPKLKKYLLTARRNMISLKAKYMNCLKKAILKERSLHQ